MTIDKEELIQIALILHREMHSLDGEIAWHYDTIREVGDHDYTQAVVPTISTLTLRLIGLKRITEQIRAMCSQGQLFELSVKEKTNGTN